MKELSKKTRKSILPLSLIERYLAFIKENNLKIKDPNELFRLFADYNLRRMGIFLGSSVSILLLISTSIALLSGISLPLGVFFLGLGSISIGAVFALASGGKVKFKDFANSATKLLRNGKNHEE